MDELVHIVWIPCDDNDQAIAIVFHAFDEGIDGFAAEIVFAADKAVGFVDKENSIEGAVYNFGGFDGGMPNVLPDKAHAVGLDEMSFLEDVQLFEDTGEDTRDGGLAGTGIA